MIPQKQKNFAKCLCGIPERFMLCMIERGWILRNKIIWHKPNHMPTSVKDRFANSWEYLFLFVKSKKYYFDLDAVREPHKSGKGSKFNLRVRDVKRGYAIKSGQYKASVREIEQYHGQQVVYNPKGKNPDDVISISPQSLKKIKSWASAPGHHFTHERRWKEGTNDDFWEVATQPYKEAHFAVFPERLVERPVKTTRENAIVLDPFAGSGTTLLVAKKLGRNYIGIDINPAYVRMSGRRLKTFRGKNEQEKKRLAVRFLP